MSAVSWRIRVTAPVLLGAALSVGALGASGCAVSLERAAAPVTVDVAVDRPERRAAGDASPLGTAGESRAPSSLPAPNAAASEQPVVSLEDLLDRITIAPETRAGYDRADWVHWNAGTDPDDGLDTRGEVLADQSLCPVRISGGRVRSGCWVSVYDGGRFENASQLDIDHVVALGEAHDSGGALWSAYTREDFANWVGGLIAVSAASNRSKGASDPAEWMPPDPAVHCEYLVSWTLTKAVWGLTMDSAEHETVAASAHECDTAGLLFEVIAAVATGLPAVEPSS